MLERSGTNLDRVSFHRWPTDRGWTRDSGPIFVKKTGPKRGRPSRPHPLRFNGWAKYDDWRLDEKIPGRVTKLLGLPEWQPCVEDRAGVKRRFVLEGGSIDVNGARKLLTTEECLLSEVQQRNPGVSRVQLEQVFRDYLGADQ